MASAGLMIFGAAAAATAAGAIYWFAIRPWFLNWGATPAEIEASMPGDDVIRAPKQVSTRAVTINAQPEDVWPWLAQMGNRRGGLYTYDLIDRLLGALDEPSAERILPEHQHLEVGDVIPIGNGPDWPVKDLEQNSFLLAHILAPGMEFTWAWVLNELDESHTRLVLRIRSQLSGPIPTLLFHLSDPGSFLMTRQHLLGIKRRAELAAWQSEEWLAGKLRRVGWLLPVFFSRQRRTAP
jgi:hypothetical protein